MWMIVIAILMIQSCSASAERPPLQLVQRILLPAVEGRIDHLAVDLKGGRLFVAALGNNTVEVIDLRAGKVARGLTGFREPQGLAYLEDSGRLIVANGGGGVEILDGQTLRVLHRLEGLPDADNVRIDTKAKRVYVGYGSGALAVIDPVVGKVTATVHLPAHPESFQLETQGSRIYVNVPASGNVTLVDRDRLDSLTSWPVTDARANYPIALDEAGKRLFVGCRRPAALLVYDTSSGRVLGKSEIAGDTDDVFFDSAKRRIYVSCGEGFIDVLDSSPVPPRRIARIPTAAGARTCLYVPALQRLYLAVRRNNGHPAEIDVYAAQ